MFELILIAAGGAAVASRPALEPDCRPQVILSGVGNALRDAPVPKRERQRTQPQPPSRCTRPCVILTNG